MALRVRHHQGAAHATGSATSEHNGINQQQSGNASSQAAVQGQREDPQSSNDSHSAGDSNNSKNDNSSSSSSDDQPFTLPVPKDRVFRRLSSRTIVRHPSLESVWSTASGRSSSVASSCGPHNTPVVSDEEPGPVAQSCAGSAGTATVTIPHQHVAAGRDEMRQILQRLIRSAKHGWYLSLDSTGDREREREGERERERERQR